MKILNLYSGLGGNRRNWGFDGATGEYDPAIEVTAVEANPQIAEVYRRHFEHDTIIEGDAHQYLLDHFEKFDFIWSSPPCQSHSKMIRSGRNRKPRYPDMQLYEEILFLKHNFKGKWVVENVVPYYAPFLEPTQLGRHLFWSNFQINQMVVPEFKNFINRQNLTAKEELMEWLGIFFEENIYYEGNHCPTQILRNCVHPDVGVHILECAIFSN